MFRSEELPPATAGAALASDVIDKRGGRLDHLLELELKLQRSMQQAIHLLSKLKKERANDVEETPLEPIRVIASNTTAVSDASESRCEQNEATQARLDERRRTNQWRRIA
jgi:hypothetical protein